MRRIRRTVAMATVLGVLAGLAFTGTALAQDSGSPSSDEPVVFNIGIGADLTSLNPFRLCCGADYEYLELVYDLGINFAPADYSAAPFIITSWTPSEDQMTWTLKVRKDATFNDGEPLTAEDVAFTFSFVVDNAMPYYKDYFPFDPQFEVVDDETVLWKSSEPTFAPEVPPYMPILPEHVWSQFDKGDPAATKQAARDFENKDPVGSGPFELAEYSPGQFLRFQYRDGYWGGTPATIDEIVFNIYDSPEAMATALKSGEIDFAEDVDQALFGQLQDQPGITTHAASAGCWGNVAWNFGGQGPKATNHPAIQDLTVRQAVAYAIDRQRIVDLVYKGTATVAYSILDPAKNNFYYKDIPEEFQYNYDPAKANQLLDDAGYLDTDGDGVREMPDGTNPLVFEFMTITDVSGSVKTGELFQSFLKEIGIDVEFKTVDQAKATDLWYTGEWDAYVWDWCPDPDPDFMLSVFTTDQCLGWSDGCYSNKAYDKLYDEQRQATDREDRRQIVYQMQDMIAQDLPLMVLNNWSDLQAYRSDRWTGFVPAPETPQGNGLLLFGYGTVRTYFALVHPSGTTATTSGGSEGLPGWIWVAVIGGVVVIVGGVMLARRRSGDEDVA
jgi:peptide/nickel transport system substrate-binding protein